MPKSDLEYVSTYNGTFHIFAYVRIRLSTLELKFHAAQPHFVCDEMLSLNLVIYSYNYSTFMHNSEINDLLSIPI